MNSNNSKSNSVMNNVNNTIVCPNCGAKFAMVEESHQCRPTNSGNKRAMERIQALKAAGVDVSNMFAMTGADGGEYVAGMQNGALSIYQDNDPIFDIIKGQGDVPNRKLFRRWVMSQMFHMLLSKRNLTEEIRSHGYTYSWKMLLNELYAQTRMAKNGDAVNLADRTRWFNRALVIDMCSDFIFQLRKYVDAQPRKKCKGVPYVRLKGGDIFVEDLQKKLYSPLENILSSINRCDNTQITKIYTLAVKFVDTYSALISKRIYSHFEMCAEWLDAYKGAGAFFTMQNLIRFHGCKFYHNCRFMSKEQSLENLNDAAEEYASEGWRLVGVMKRLLSDNRIDIEAKVAEFSKK